MAANLFKQDAEKVRAVKNVRDTFICIFILLATLAFMVYIAYYAGSHYKEPINNENSK